MKALLALFQELAGLFVEDGALALAIVAVVALAGILAALFPIVPWASGAVLLIGCLGVLLVNVMKFRRR
jgi:hypothetical protein